MLRPRCDLITRVPRVRHPLLVAVSYFGSLFPNECVKGIKGSTPKYTTETAMLQYEHKLIQCIHSLEPSYVYDTSHFAGYRERMAPQYMR